MENLLAAMQPLECWYREQSISPALLLHTDWIENRGGGLELNPNLHSKLSPGIHPPGFWLHVCSPVPDPVPLEIYKQNFKKKRKLNSANKKPILYIIMYFHLIVSPIFRQLKILHELRCILKKSWCSKSLIDRWTLSWCSISLLRTDFNYVILNGNVEGLCRWFCASN